MTTRKFPDITSLLDPQVIHAQVRLAVNLSLLLQKHKELCTGSGCDVSIIDIIEDAHTLGIGITMKG